MFKQIILAATLVSTSAIAGEVTYRVPDKAGANSPAGVNWVQASDAAASVYHQAVPASENDANKIKSGLKLCGAQIRGHRFKPLGQVRIEPLGDVKLQISPEGCMLTR